VRMVRATTRCSSGVISPNMAVQRMRLWARAAHTSQAPEAPSVPSCGLGTAAAGHELATG
jgi:hypothetical protein